MYSYTKRRFGEVPEPFAVVAHHPRLLFAPTPSDETMLQSVHASCRQACANWRALDCAHHRVLWCVDFGSMVRAFDGLDVERIKDIENYATSHVSPMIASRDRLRRRDDPDPHSVTDDQVADLRTRFGENGVVELTYQIGTEKMRARMITALGITEQGFNSGDASGSLDNRALG